jgi:hypothetical protein
LTGIISQYADQLYPEEHQEAQEDVGTADAELAKEIAALTRKNKEGTRRFYCLDTGVKGLILIRFTEGRMEPVAFMTRATDSADSSRLNLACRHFERSKQNEGTKNQVKPITSGRNKC